MTTRTILDPVAEANGRIVRLLGRRAVLISELLAATARRDFHSRDYLLYGEEHHKGWASAVADEAHASALLADIKALLPVLSDELASAEANVKVAAEKAWKAAFEARLAVVLREKSIVVPSGEEANFKANTLAAYRWLATMRRTTEVDRSRYLIHWLDEMSAAKYGSVRPVEFIAAAFVHGDVAVEDGGEAWNVFIGINPFIGRDAQSVPLT
jgi:hypothetical protein